jgi:cyclopropane-fatty-acyl-phospholipid synthase
MSDELRSRDAAVQVESCGSCAHELSPKLGAGRAAALLQRIFRRYAGQLTLKLWTGKTLDVGDADPLKPASSFTLVFRSVGAVRALVLGRDPLRLAEAYIRNDLDVEGDFLSAVALKDQLDVLPLTRRERLAILILAIRLCPWPWRSNRSASAGIVGSAADVKAHSKREDLRAIRFHYDVSNEFYALWLGESMVYSCAYFDGQESDLDQAQRAKLDHLCRKLRLVPGERLLDVGCGWGGLIIHAARHYGVIAHGVTLSREQFAEAQRRIAEAGLENRVTVELRDYRDLAGESLYDKVSSVGMFEHVGLKNLPGYYAAIHRLLKAGGLFLNHGITHDVEGWRPTSGTEFINRYVFPGGQLDTVGNIQRGMERARFEITDVEALRRHYAMTLRHWVRRLERARTQALQYVNESTYRVWRLYMAACAVDFESGELGVYQILASKRDPAAAAQPLTRRYLYAASAADETAPGRFKSANHAATRVAGHPL